MYYVLYHINKDNIKVHPKTVKNYDKYIKHFDWGKISFPLQITTKT